MLVRRNSTRNRVARHPLPLRTAMLKCCSGLFALLWCALPRAQEAPRPEVVIGGQASFEGRVMGVDCLHWTTTEITPDGMVRTTCGEYVIESSLANDLNPVRLKNAAGKELVYFTPFAPSVKFPLSVGKRWSGAYVGYTDYNKLLWDGETSCKVEAFEKITVRAGDYEAFRIECKQGWKVGTRGGFFRATRWYAPAIGLVVKEVHQREPERWNLELTNYTLPAPPAPVKEASPSATAPPRPRPSYDPDSPNILDPNEY